MNSFSVYKLISFLKRIFKILMWLSDLDCLGHHVETAVEVNIDDALKLVKRVELVFACVENSLGNANAGAIDEHLQTSKVLSRHFCRLCRVRRRGHVASAK